VRGLAHPGGVQYAQGSFSGHAGARGLGAHGGHRTLAAEHGAALHVATGEVPAQWMQGQAVPGQYRAGRGQGPHGYASGGQSRGGRGGHWNGPGVPYNGAIAGRGGYINHMRGGAPAEAAAGTGPGGLGFRASGGVAPGAVPGGRSGDFRNQQQYGQKGGKPVVQVQQQPYMNGRTDARELPATRNSFSSPGVDSQSAAANVVPGAMAADAESVRAPGDTSATSSAAHLAAEAEFQGSSAVGDDGASAAAKEAADKARREAKKKSKKEKLRKGKEDSTPSSTPHDTPVINALQPPEQAPPLRSFFALVCRAEAWHVSIGVFWVYQCSPAALFPLCFFFVSSTDLISPTSLEKSL
jgi:hypothetical protein